MNTRSLRSKSWFRRLKLKLIKKLTFSEAKVMAQPQKTIKIRSMSQATHRLEETELII
tara:strand:+ start:359 stop:532 length:174 start_codon:yes stop_codon:yes gene_type:complete